MQKRQPEPRSACKVRRTISPRWIGNNAHGRVNNVTSHSRFDVAVDAHLIEQGVLDIQLGKTVGLVIETLGNYFESLVFPETVEAGIRVAHLGNSSVRYEVGLFAQDTPVTAAKVYVDWHMRRPTPLPDPLKTVLEQLL